jgi:hypothetical protein
MRWEIPQKEADLARWIRRLSTKEIGQFIDDVEYLIGPDDGRVLYVDEPWGGRELSQEAVMAVVVGAARLWRDSHTDPLHTIRSLAPAGFYADEVTR